MTTYRSWAPEFKGLPNYRVDDDLRFSKNCPQGVFAPKTLGIDFIYIFGSGRASRKPSIGSDDFDAADWRVISRRSIEYLLDGFSSQGCCLHVFRR